MKKIVSVIAAALTLAAFTVPCRAAGEISAHSAIVIEADTLAVLYEKNPDERMQMASTTKIMTALVVLENCALDETVKVKPECAGVEGSSIYLKAGDEISVEALLYGLLLESGNDAASALACHAAGSTEAFAEMMNSRALQIGCTATHFVNPHGLDAEGHYSTARDLALIMAEAMKNEAFCRVVSTMDVTIEGRIFSNHNKLLSLYDGCLGGKTGYTKSSGRSLVSCAEREGMRIICVTLKAPDDWDDHTALYDRCFAQWKKITVDGEKYRFAIPVVSGTEQTVYAKIGKTASILFDKGSETEITVDLKKFLYAPVEEGCEVGKVTVKENGEEVFSSPILTEKAVETDSGQFLTFGERLKRFLEMAVEGSFEKMGYEPEG